MVCCWSVKGGVGTSVVAAALAVLAARRSEALLVDLAGDQPALLGVDPDGPALGDWLAAGDEVAVDALRRLEVTVAPDLHLLASGDLSISPIDSDRLTVALALTDRPSRTTVVDLGVVVRDDPRLGLLALAARSVHVTRPCYLALRRARSVPVDTEHRVVLVDEPGRALGRRDVAAALGVDSVHRVPWDPAVARAVDAGTMVARLPGPLRRLERLL